MNLDHDYLFYKPLEQGDVVLVLGATHGDFIREYRDEIIRKNVFVINVEPTLEGVRELSLYIKERLPENACVLSVALADTASTMSMDIRDNLITSTLDNRPETNQRWPMRLLYKQKTLVLTLDDVLNAVPKINKIFSDIEGSELEVFGGSKLVNKVPYIAIAAYHVRDGIPTHNKLSSMLTGYKVHITGEASRNKEEAMFFAVKE